MADGLRHDLHSIECSTMTARAFKTPAPWGIGPGPAKLYSIEGALHAVDMWLDLTPDRAATAHERQMMLTLRDVLAAIPDSVAEADLQSAKRAIKGMVKYAQSRESALARTLAMAPPQARGARRGAS